MERIDIIQVLDTETHLLITNSAGSVNGKSSSNANKDYQNDILNLYFMHPNENLTLILVTYLLTNNTYHS